MEINEFIVREKSRGDCYKFLSACFYLPQKELFAEENLLNNLTKSLEIVSPDAAVFSKQMENTFLSYSNDDLTVAFAKLFVGPFELKAPPYGSVYLDMGRRVMGDSTIDVLEVYKQAGLSMDEEFKEMPDHITVELEFMYYLIFKEVEAVEKSEFDTALKFIETQELFLDKFFKRWITPFCDRIKNGTDNEFYKSLADCVSAFIESSHPGNLPDELKKITAQA